MVMAIYTYKDHQNFEANWWGDCTNTFGEETKQITYAHRMGLKVKPYKGWWPVYDMEGKTVLDMGGGPTSILLKTINLKSGVVVDPCRYPGWIYERYNSRGIVSLIEPAETVALYTHFDECWMYNVLQHVMDPHKIVEKARKHSKVVRIFEWINLEPHLGHPQKLLEKDLNSWLDGVGTVERMTGENGCDGGDAYYGVFQ